MRIRWGKSQQNCLFHQDFIFTSMKFSLKPVSSNLGSPFFWYSAKGKAQSQNPTFLG